MFKFSMRWFVLHLSKLNLYWVELFQSAWNHKIFIFCWGELFTKFPRDFLSLSLAYPANMICWLSYRLIFHFTYISYVLPYWRPILGLFSVFSKNLTIHKLMGPFSRYRPKTSKLKTIFTSKRCNLFEGRTTIQPTN